MQRTIQFEHEHVRSFVTAMHTAPAFRSDATSEAEDFRSGRERRAAASLNGLPFVALKWSSGGVENAMSNFPFAWSTEFEGEKHRSRAILYRAIRVDGQPLRRQLHANATVTCTYTYIP